MALRLRQLCPVPALHSGRGTKRNMIVVWSIIEQFGVRSAAKERIYAVNPALNRVQSEHAGEDLDSRCLCGSSFVGGSKLVLHLRPYVLQ